MSYKSLEYCTFIQYAHAGATHPHPLYICTGYTKLQKNTINQIGLSSLRPGYINFKTFKGYLDLI